MWLIICPGAARRKKGQNGEGKSNSTPGAVPAGLDNAIDFVVESDDDDDAAAHRAAVAAASSPRVGSGIVSLIDFLRGLSVYVLIYCSPIFDSATDIESHR